MIYFDNAATGGFKPDEVLSQVCSTLKHVRANSGRSGHSLSNLADQKIFETRKLLSKFFGCGSAERIVFTSNCTEALNMAIMGTVKKGGNVVTAVTEHNAVLRPLFYLESLKLITLTIVEPATSCVLASDIEEAISDDTYLIVVNAISNLTGAQNDVEGIGTLAKEKNLLFLCDCAQAAGHKKIDMQRQNIDILCAAGHKGLLGIQGVGVLAFSQKTKIKPLVFGGTGSDSFNKFMPDHYPEKLEAGTMNLPAIISLFYGVNELIGNLSYIENRLLSLTEYLIKALNKRQFIRLYSIPNASGIVAFSHNEVPSQEFTQIMSDRYQIALRGGFHCAPLMHKFLKTQKLGLVRVSLAPQNTKKEIDFFINAIDEISI